MRLLKRVVTLLGNDRLLFIGLTVIIYVTTVCAVGIARR